jgi:hypothetical protein
MAGESMTLKLINANAVVAARQFNPSVFSQIWLVQNGILNESDLEDEFAFTPAFAQVGTKEFALLVLPERLQFVPRVDEEDRKQLILQKVGRIVEALPHTPFFAMGMNFTLHLFPEKTDVKDLTRSLFFVKDSSLHREFDTADARFGGYLSKDALGCRLKFEVKPGYGQMEGVDAPEHFIMMECNFHHDLEPGPKTAGEIMSILGQWDAALALAKRLAAAICERDGK